MEKNLFAGKKRWERFRRIMQRNKKYLDSQNNGGLISR